MSERARSWEAASLALCAYATLAPRRSRPRRDRGLRHRAGSGRDLASAGGGDPAGADALGERRPLLSATRFRGSRHERRFARARSSRCSRPSATVTARPCPSSSSTSQSSASAAAGTRASFAGAYAACVPRAQGSRSTTEGSSRTCWSRPAIPGWRCRGSSRATSAPSTRTSRTSTHASRGRRRRDGRRDRVAERARGRRRSRLGAPARARATSAQPSPAALLQARLVVVPRDEPERARRAATPPR